jgi:hypothetical protein
MYPSRTAGHTTSAVALPRRTGRLVLLLLPGFLLGIVTLRAPGEARFILSMGTAFQVFACTLALLNGRRLYQPLGPALIMLYVIALGWVMIGGVGLRDWVLYFAQAILLMVPLGIFAVQCLRDSGAPAIRRANQLAHRLARRTKWPADLQACRLLPEVKALRQALHMDALPALELLADPRPQVRVAALASLEYRSDWRPGQERIVLTIGQREEEPVLRAAAIAALANVDDQITIEALADFLHDPSPVVRQAAGESLLWNTEEIWPWIRNAVRFTLADPTCRGDGPLRPPGNLFPPEAIADLTAWASEKGLLGMRASQTLGIHYSQLLAAQPDPEQLAYLRYLVIDPRTPTFLRLELVQLLLRHQALDGEALSGLIRASTPAPLRLLAADTLLSQGHSPRAVGALYELARLPNREIALSTAEVVQKHLDVDLGLEPGWPPTPESREAAEVIRRLVAWAATPSDLAEESVEDSTFLPPHPLAHS